MTGQTFDILMVFVFFIYGLSFFGMGLTLALESEHSPALVEAHLLRPLAAFGMIHGVHEWLESYLLQSQIVGMQLPGWVAWLRLGLLTASFIPLVIYGLISLHRYPLLPRGQFLAAVSLLAVFCLGILTSAFITYHAGPTPWVGILDGLARYLLAVPGAFLAALALRAQALRSWDDDPRRMKIFLSVASIGFMVYALTQIFVPQMAMFPASLINAAEFRTTLGFPIQLVRTIAAITITIGMLRASQLMEKQRQANMLAIQKSNLEAMERVHAEMEKRELMRRELLRHVVQAQEEERARIARELHDETAQTLAAFSLDLATLRLAASKDNANSTHLITRLQDLCKQMSKGLYRLVHDLRPAQLDDLGLVPAVQFLVDQDSNSKELEVKFDVQGTVRRLDPVVETVLFRVTQEALNNVIRHSQTKKASVCLTFQSQEITLTIADSGVGFDPAESFSPPRGWGLSGMRERVEAVGGQLIIHSAPGKGTMVEVIVDVFDLIP